MHIECESLTLIFSNVYGTVIPWWAVPLDIPGVNLHLVPSTPVQEQLVFQGIVSWYCYDIPDSLLCLFVLDQVVHYRVPFVTWSCPPQKNLGVVLSIIVVMEDARRVWGAWNFE